MRWRLQPAPAPTLLLVLLVATVAAVVVVVRAEPQVPCYFVFGDSLVDNGNNNDIASLARANYPPYGIDFAAGPTGRFSNGLTTVDAISRLLGFDDYIPAYAGASGDQLLTGVNFASAAAGIRDETGQQLGQRISFGGQLQNYQAAVQQLVSILGDEDSAASHLSQCIFTVGMGSNDYLNNYFMPAVYSTSQQYTPEQYADVLINQYSQQLRTLYSYGARKVALMGVGQVGCSPNELAQRSTDGTTCVPQINGAIDIFNRKLVALVDQFNALPGAHFTYINVYGIFQDILRAPGSHGLTVTNQGCCGVGRNNGQVTCLPFQTPCANRNEYLFWDAFHPTEAANILVGRRAYSAALPSDVHPMDLRTLARI
ncbi:anther-specific proline-rich protein APG precursor [Zea mays]|uniref:Anther-specific proline-rich protein APG n=1 Tax=Zea mays TaxID=4577 RepID=B4F9E3_MAIZE|nr:anther-specific proline-rich protein APG precursor [Zea mays]ACF78736.1 unknown [Zea mays]ACF85836.1 unknown [Zea mays]ACG32365.1 anther-specific proline-rich protein APG [Zea mays]ACG34104.1 anther-specific proline-rich protein APG [Zea mays]ONM38095.1 GDSL esterase/lipase [Zea mays]|eukprot:NP_001149080.1 anther-specific proline-rich protein APG precursor [Zea mays]